MHEVVKHKSVRHVWDPNEFKHSRRQSATSIADGLIPDNNRIYFCNSLLRKQHDGDEYEEK